MGMTYTYSTGKIERDFVLKKVDGNCNVDKEHNKPIGVMCQTCPHFIKMETFYHSPKDQYILNLDTYGTFVFCKYYKEDDEGTQDVLYKLYSDFKHEALCHFDD